MIHITTNSANEAWLSAFRSLVERGGVTDNSKYLRDEPMVIEILQPDLDPIDDRFPMDQVDIDVINKFIYSGENEHNVVHDWTKLYYHRAFDEPNSQINFLVSKLKEDLPVGEAIISMWDKNQDQDQRISPCTLVIWARIKHQKLELHVHAHSSDGYKKLLMNILEFISLQKYIASLVSLPLGKYYHFLDSAHLHVKDQAKINELYAQTNDNKF